MFFTDRFLVVAVASLIVAAPCFRPSSCFSQSPKLDEQSEGKRGQDKNKGDKKSKDEKKKERPPFAWVNKPSKKYAKYVDHKTFASPSLRLDVGYNIVLPPQYDESDKQSESRFPVVYYLHGGRPGSESKSLGVAAIVAEHLQAGRVDPMIYVFVNGGPVSHYNMPNQPEAQGADIFIKELIPHIDTTYRTIANRAGRGIEGFSQGGRATMRLALRYPDLFCSAASGGGGHETERRISESGGRESDKLVFHEGDNTWDLARAYSSAREFDVEWLLYVGTQGFNYHNNLEYMQFLNSLGIGYRRMIVAGVEHSGTKIYQRRGLEVMKFHARNFANAAKSASSR